MDNLYGYKITDSIYPQMKIIETDKFILRPVTLNDVNDLYEYYSIEKVLKYLPFKKHYTIFDTKNFIKSFFINNYKRGLVGHCAIFYKPDNKVIGNIGLNNISINAIEAEIGICINPKYWGHDFATELTINSLIYGFELLNLEKLVAITYENNIHTRKSLESLGFSYIKTYPLKLIYYTGNVYVSCHRFELLRSDYLLYRPYNLS
ncbi:MAG: GNAT family N-acetyltransferase [Romboutsia sp.]|uniref:GNAT family N-acetyltransferase n=1 Tax=Romboutsia sp. TaxID=1965302 RepID=UPI003F3E09BE